ncbi:hypothetical protein GIB67_005974 [Kingdonia uniflora]|uniref:Uncharacterized protein n=1 Tax=Kingdonia uniflora TaxID=39325 RepID=A0A7J7MC07_9MAGN|nr:hypothetical protein GIB67_005974 [Kingdonia uniflora]
MKVSKLSATIKLLTEQVRLINIAKASTLLKKGVMEVDEDDDFVNLVTATPVKRLVIASSKHSQPVVPLDVIGFDDHHGLSVVRQKLQQSKACDVNDLLASCIIQPDELEHKMLQQVGLSRFGIQDDRSVIRANNGEILDSGFRESGARGDRVQYPVQPLFDQVTPFSFVGPGDTHRGSHLGDGGPVLGALVRVEGTISKRVEPGSRLCAGGMQRGVRMNEGVYAIGIRGEDGEIDIVILGKPESSRVLRRGRNTVALSQAESVKHPESIRLIRFGLGKKDNIRMKFGVMGQELPQGGPFCGPLQFHEKNMEDPYKVKIIEQCQISPPLGSVPQTSLSLTFFDLRQLRNPPSLTRLFYYEIPCLTKSHFMISILPDLKHSLSLTLQYFFSLAGNLIWSPECSKPEILYVEGDSVSLSVAELTDFNFNDVCGNNFRDIDMLLALMPRLLSKSDAILPQLALQVTLFPNSGICIGVTVSHAAVDAKSFSHFVKFWASVCKLGGDTSFISTGPSSVLPVYDRTMFKDPNGIQTFLEKIKITRQFKALGCHYDDNVREHFFFPVECRDRLNPALPKNYFGNCLVPCLTFANKEDLLGKDGIVVAAEVIGKGIQMSIKGVLEGFQDDLANCSLTALEHVSGIAGSPKWKFYETNFGWGRPKKVELCTTHHTKGVSFSERSDGETGIDIEVLLNKIDMDAFKINFADTIKTYL